MSAPPLLVFDRAASLLHILTANGALSWRAENNAQRSSRGPWPVGVFEPEVLVQVGGEDANPSGTFGPVFVRYSVPGRVGMGLHSGRRDDPDGLGRTGPGHATNGCIRTSDEATGELLRLVRHAAGQHGQFRPDQLPPLWVPR